MENRKLSSEHINQLIKKLEETALHCSDTDQGCEDTSSEIYRIYSLETESGKQIYQRLEDRYLLNILQTQAKYLGHSPAQKEIFWVWRSYIKKRFVRWPYALEAAGLKKAAGKGGKTTSQIQKEKDEYQSLLDEIRIISKRLCRIPHPQEIPELTSQLMKHTKNWNDIIRDAGLDQKFFREKAVYRVTQIKPEVAHDLETVRQLAYSLGRPPLKSEVPQEIRARLIKQYSSFRNVLYQIGLDPVTRINPFSSTYIRNQASQDSRMHRTDLHDCYYQIINPDAQTIKDLDELYKLRKKYNHLPEKKEVPPELRKRLQESCGSWANALNQLNYIGKDIES